MKLAIISDIHEDVVNLQHVLRQIGKENCDQIICLGDIAGFSNQYYHHSDTRDASECLRLVRENCSIIIPGNHDLHAIQKIPENIKGFEYPDNWYEFDGLKQSKIGDDRVWLYNDDELEAGFSKKDKEFIDLLNELEVFNIEETGILFTHFIYPNLTGSLRTFYFDNVDFNAHKAFMAEYGCNISFSGHRHYLGLLISSESSLIDRGFNKKYLVQQGDCIMVPPVVGNRFESGFCIFDIDNFNLIAKRI